jgi:hypothetical protein
LGWTIVNDVISNDVIIEPILTGGSEPVDESQDLGTKFVIKKHFKHWTMMPVKKDKKS